MCFTQKKPAQKTTDVIYTINYWFVLSFIIYLKPQFLLKYNLIEIYINFRAAPQLHTRQISFVLVKYTVYLYL